ncbi:MAG: class I SAM-dependent methyltransferase [Candidatus Jordarchaeaceae archaeon]
MLALKCLNLNVKQGQRCVVLDVGTGSGIILPKLAERANDVVGLDIHDKLNQVNRSLKIMSNSNIHLVRADAHHLPFVDETFQGILCISTLDHLSKPEDCLNELQRVTAKDGQLIFGIHIENIVFNLFHLVILLYSKFRGYITNVRTRFSEHIYSDKMLLLFLRKRFLIRKIIRQLSIYCIIVAEPRKYK